MEADNEMHYFGQIGLTQEQIKKARALMKAGVTLEGIETYMNVPYSVLIAIRYGKFHK